MVARTKEGKFKKALVKVGDLVSCNLSGFNPGFTKDKPYKVIATSRSSFENRNFYSRVSGDICLNNPQDFAVLDDDGQWRKLSLIVESDSEWRKTSAKVFGEWMVIP